MQNLNDLLREPLIEKFYASLLWHNDKYNYDLMEKLLVDVCEDYGQHPEKYPTFFILEQKLDSELINHFSEEE